MYRLGFDIMNQLVIIQCASNFAKRKNEGIINRFTIQ